MRASDFEFRYRFWIFGGIYWAAFSLYFVDPVNSATAVAQWIAGPAADLDVPPGRALHQGVLAAGTLVTLVACVLRTWASAYLASEIVHDPNLRTEGVVADGPYRHVRNPLYLGNIVLGLGMGLMASRTGWVLLQALQWLFLQRLIAREEAELEQSQGESYRAYCAAVPRLWPSLRPRVPPGGARPQWPQAFAGEFFMWAFAVACLVFALTLHMLFALAPVIATLVAYAVSQALRKTKPERNTDKHR